MPDPKTKVCDDCDSVIAADAKVCPACGMDFEETEETIKALDHAEKVRAKRKARSQKEPEKKVETPNQPESVFRKLMRLRKEREANNANK